jgi:hypothetical protein
MEHTGTTAVEKALPPKVLKQTEILDGVAMDSAPALKGYVKFIAKPTAETERHALFRPCRRADDVVVCDPDDQPQDLGAECRHPGRRSEDE